MRRCWRVAGSVLAAGLLLVGCVGEDCTDAGCIDSLYVSFPGGVLESGSWDISVDADGMHWDCTVDVPHVGTSTPACTGYDVQAWERGITFDWTPKELRIQAYRDGALTLAIQVEPTYEEFAPNGRECGPVCIRSEVELEEVVP